MHTRTIPLHLAILPLAVAFVLPSAAQQNLAAIATGEPEELETFGRTVLSAVEQADRDAYLKNVVVTLDDMEGIYQKLPKEVTENMPEDRKPGSEALAELMRQQRTAVAESFDALLAFPKKYGIELGHPLRLEDVEHTPIRPQGDFLTCESATVKFSAGGVSGFAVRLQELGRADRGWIAYGPVSWVALPDALLTDEARKGLNVAKARSEGTPLPAGQEAPDISFVRLSDGTEEKLSDFRGKVVVLDFWASWCGPCQEPMAKMQTYREQHPEWGDQVALIALSIDNTEKQAVDHLTEKGWNQSHNVWSGAGGFRAPPPQAFNVQGIPTVYILDKNGVIAKSGHPAAFDIPREVGALLSK